MEKLIIDLQDMPVTAIKEMDLHHLVDVMLENIGNTNPNLRENTCGAFHRLVDEAILENEDCRRVFATCFEDSHLFNGIGSTAEDSVFYRSFSSLVITIILGADSKRCFLSQDQYAFSLNKSFDYMDQEVDRRGYVTGKGWAHAIAHGADMLCSFVEHPRFDIAFTEDVLKSIKPHLTYENRYTDGEESRLASVVPALLNKGAKADVVQYWISGLSPVSKAAPYTDKYYKNVCATHNLEYFLKSLYIMLESKSENEGLSAYILQFLQTIWSWASD